MRGDGEVDEAAREASALRYPAQEVLPVPQATAPEQLVEHDVDRRRSDVAHPFQIGKPAFLWNRQPGAREPARDGSAAVFRRIVGQEPVDVSGGKPAVRDDARERLDERVRYDLVVEEPHVLLQREYRIRLALARGIKHPAAQCTVGLL